ncbi:MAG: VOC family protein [Acidobacteriaceae bacterium]|jgi:catechol 2,3-dioxygenase-like lactoylglutathione lyase family enzyme|nr:VOC family protein [Acidobacteriaceae bacterium]
MKAQLTLSRRELLLSVPALAVASRLLAQSGGTLKIRALNHLTIGVADVKRSVDFYQGLFGMPIQARQGTTIVLRIGNGPQFLAIGPAGANVAPSITHYCVTIEDFNVDRVLSVLAAHGVTKAEATGGGMSGGPMKVRVRMRGPESGGAPGGTPELYVGDPDGVVVQLQDPKYAGGAGALGEIVKVEAAPSKGLIALKDLSHFTVFATDSERSNKFYHDIFGTGIRSYQGPTAPTVAIGSTVQFVMFTGGGGGGARAGAPPAPPRPANINHVSFNMDNFKPDEVTKALESYGIKPRESQTGAVPPLRHYISMRMENRGGAKDGTPELYFTDPDGILVQIQDTSYCGGGGFLGNLCPPV